MVLIHILFLSLPVIVWFSNLAVLGVVLHNFLICLLYYFLLKCCVEYRVMFSNSMG